MRMQADDEKRAPAKTHAEFGRLRVRTDLGIPCEEFGVDIVHILQPRPQRCLEPCFVHLGRIWKTGHKADEKLFRKVAYREGLQLGRQRPVMRRILYISCLIKLDTVPLDGGLGTDAGKLIRTYKAAKRVDESGFGFSVHDSQIYSSTGVNATTSDLVPGIILNPEDIRVGD